MTAEAQATSNSILNLILHMALVTEHVIIYNYSNEINVTLDFLHEN